MRDNSPHMDGRSGTGPVFPQVASWFSIAGLPAQRSVFPKPPLPGFKFPHSFGYFKLVLRLCSFTLAPNLIDFPSVAVTGLYQHSNKS